jgi:hypothetical protein
MTTSTSFVQGSADRETLEQLSDAELLRRAARQVLKVLCMVSKIMLVKPTLAVARPAETGVLVRALAQCLRDAIDDLASSRSAAPQSTDIGRF